MQHCSHCGEPLDGRSRICVRCGVSVDDAPGFLFAFLAFLFPIIGVVYFIAKCDTYPSRAGSVLKGAIAGFVVFTIVGAIAGIKCARFLSDWYDLYAEHSLQEDDFFSAMKELVEEAKRQLSRRNINI